MDSTYLRTKRVAIAIIVALGVMFGPEAHAQSQPGAVIVVGESDARVRELVAANVESTLKEAAWSVVALRLSSMEIDKMTACLGSDRPWPCLYTNSLTKGAERLLVVQLNIEPGAGNVKDLVLTGELIVADDTVPSIERQSCTRCADTELARIARLLTTKLLDNTASRSGAPTLEVKTTPPGANVTIDGLVVGESNAAFITSTGSHEITVALRGYRSATQKVTTPAGKRTSIAITLERDSTKPPERTDGGRSRLLPGLIASAGVVAVAAGSLISYNADPDPNDRQKYIYSTPGIVLAAAGGAAIGVGVFLWFYHPKSASTPTVTLTPGGGVAGWATRF